MTRQRALFSGLTNVLAIASLSMLVACTPDGDGNADSDNAASAARQQPAALADPAINGTVPDMTGNLADTIAITHSDSEPVHNSAQKIELVDIAPADLPDPDNSVVIQPFPQEVTDFMVDRDSCDHFRGEEPYDDERRQFLEENIRVLCTGSDGRLAVLRRKYRDNAEVIAALEPYEKLIERTEE